MPWQEASIGYFSQPLRAYEKSPVWTSIQNKPVSRPDGQHAMAGLRRISGLCLSRRDGRLCYSQYGGAGRLGRQVAGRCCGRGTEARRTLLQALSSSAAAMPVVRPTVDGPDCIGRDWHDLRDCTAGPSVVRMVAELLNRTVLSFLFMLPAARILLLFLTYPLSLGIWMGFTDARSGDRASSLVSRTSSHSSTTMCSGSRFLTH